MQSLHNQLEYNYLVKAFGVRDSMNLKAFLTSRMSTSEVDNIKKILKTKKINML
jgi:glutaredoxin-related protein